MRSTNSACLIAVCIAFFSTGGATAAAEKHETPQSGADKKAAVPSKFHLPKRVPITVDRAKFREGWKQEVPIPNSDGGICIASVKDGWLHAERRNGEHGLDWHLVLARVSAEELPVISVFDTVDVFEVSYGGGRYFVRDDGTFLRSVRERKARDGLASAADLLGKRFRTAGMGNTIGLVMTGRNDGEWFFVTSGPDPRNQDQVDVVLRLNPTKMAGRGYGLRMSLGPTAYFFHGNAWMLDDGDLLAVRRTSESAYKAEMAEQTLRKKLLGSAAPKLSAAKWLNTSDELSWEKLKGSVVLLDFWGTWCGPCVKKLPEVEKFAQQYAGRGVVVIGVHSAQGSEGCPDFVKKKKVAIPIAVDTGRTAKSYGVTAWPSLFLIDRKGKIVSGFTTDLPSEATVERLLKN